MSIGIVHDHRIPLVIKALGARWRDGKHSYRMQWGELGFRSGWGVDLCLFGEDPHFSLHLHAFWVSAYINLPFLRRWAHEPDEMMESWGASKVDDAIHLHWGKRTKLLYIPWRNWVQTAHDVRRDDGSWAPFVGSWEHKEPDGRETETYPYRYMLRSGEVQNVEATIYVERRQRKLKWLRWLPFKHTRYAISVDFSGEIGERAGSWKGGCTGCGYELRPNETPRECLKRMESERKF